MDILYSLNCAIMTYALMLFLFFPLKFLSSIVNFLQPSGKHLGVSSGSQVSRIYDAVLAMKFARLKGLYGRHINNN